MLIDNDLKEQFGRIQSGRERERERERERKIKKKLFERSHVETQVDCSQTDLDSVCQQFGREKKERKRKQTDCFVPEDCSNVSLCIFVH